MKGRCTISCATKLFWMTKSIFQKTTFIDLGDIKLLCITHWTLLRRSTTSGGACFLMCLPPCLKRHLGLSPTVKSLVISPTSRETSVKSTQACLPSTHPRTKTSVDWSVNLLSCGSVKEIHGCLFLHRYFCTPESIKKNISNQVMHVFESRELPTMSRVLPMHALPQIEQTSSIGNYGIMMWYIRVVEYFTGYMCWPNPSMWIVRRNPKHVLFSNTQKLLFASRSHQ
jgi:hypothetical protein